MNIGKYKTIDISTPINGRVVVVKKYWICVDGDPAKAITYDDNPLCNAHKSIADRMLNYTKEKTGWNVKVVFIELAFRPQIDHWQNTQL